MNSQAPDSPRPTRGADRNRSLADRRPALLPALDPGVTLLSVDGRGVPVVQSLVLDRLLTADGPAFWVDAKSVAYVVVDDDKSSRDRVALAHEDPGGYDAGYYETLLVRAVESVLSPLGWDCSDIRRALDGTRNGDRRAYSE